MDYQVVLSPSARADLRDIVRYISFDAPDRALEFGRFLVSRTRLLAGSPELGRIVPEFEEAFIREIIVRSYRVVYRVDDSRDLVEVIRFWHAARGTPEIPSA
jgi:plasmid stabilization system protein ParE